MRAAFCLISICRLDIFSFCRSKALSYKTFKARAPKWEMSVKSKRNWVGEWLHYAPGRQRRAINAVRVPDCCCRWINLRRLFVARISCASEAIQTFNSISIPSLLVSSCPGRPFALQNCTVSNQSIETIHVECIEGFDGGLPQMFLLEMVEIPTLKLVRNLTLYVSLKRFRLFLSIEPFSRHRYDRSGGLEPGWCCWPRPRPPLAADLFCRFYLPKTRNNLFGQFLCEVRADWKLFQQFNRIFKCARTVAEANKFRRRRNCFG